MRLSNSCTWFKIRRNILNSIGHSFGYDFLSEGNKGFATSCVKLVFEVSESFPWDLNVSWNEVAWDSWMKFVKFCSHNDVILPSHKEMIRNDWFITIRTPSVFSWAKSEWRFTDRWFNSIWTASIRTDLAYDLILLFTIIFLLLICLVERILFLLNWQEGSPCCFWLLNYFNIIPPQELKLRDVLANSGNYDLVVLNKTWLNVI